LNFNQTKKNRIHIFLWREIETEIKKYYEIIYKFSSDSWFKILFLMRVIFLDVFLIFKLKKYRIYDLYKDEYIIDFLFGFDRQNNCLF